MHRDGGGGDRLPAGGVANHPDNTSRLAQRIAATQQSMRLLGTRRCELHVRAAVGCDVDHHRRNEHARRIEHRMIERQPVSTGWDCGEHEVAGGIAARHAVRALDPDLRALERPPRDQTVEHHAAQDAGRGLALRRNRRRSHCQAEAADEDQTHRPRQSYRSGQNVSSGR